jgi:hypothetical protein
MMHRAVAIVDPYSSGALLAPEFRKQGFTCVMVQGADPVPPIYRPRYRARDFAALVRHGRSLEETAAGLRRWNVRHVVAGCEAGVTLADRLNGRLGLPSNGARQSQARRNKFLMAETVRRHRLRAPSQTSSRSLGKILLWARGHGTWPVVLKPPASTGNDGVRVCRSEGEVADAYGAIMGRTNSLGLRNTAVLAQEYLTGTEYVVDTVSWDGRHRAAAFWKYSKPAWDPYPVGYDRMELLPGDGDVQRRLFAYVTGVLDALGVRYGPAHSEVMWTDDGPALVEVGARMNGGNCPTVARFCTGTSQLDLTVQAYADPGGFLRREARPYDLLRNGTLVFLMPRKRCRLRGLRRLDEIRKLRSYRAHSVGTRRAAVAPRVVGWVLLAHEDQAALDADLARIRGLEEGGLYDLVEEAPTRTRRSPAA